MAKTVNILVIALYVAYSFVGGETGECTILEDGATECRTDGNLVTKPRGGTGGGVIGTPTRCQAPSSLYSWGGTAVAYRPNVGAKTNVCSQQTKYKIASWFGRRATWKAAPTISFTVNVHACDERSSVGDPSTCICRKLQNDDGDDPSPVSVEVWQTRPDGTYPSLLVDKDKSKKTSDNEASSSLVDECRAKQSGSSSVTFHSLAPGSTGGMGGLGPLGWDFGPYRPPVLHILVRGPSGYVATLVDVPIAVHPQSLEHMSFRGPDFSGPAWTRSKEGGTKDGTKMYRVSSWRPAPMENRAVVEIDVFLPRASSSSASSLTEIDRALCPSLLYGIPRSFFTEPIALCAPSMLNFFPL